MEDVCKNLQKQVEVCGYGFLSPKAPPIYTHPHPRTPQAQRPRAAGIWSLLFLVSLGSLQFKPERGGGKSRW